MTQRSVTERDKIALLAALPADGGFVGNHALRRQLKWSDDRYWSTRDALVDEGAVLRGRGRGGSIHRAASAPTDTLTIAVDVTGDSVDPATTVREAIHNELELYEPMRAVIANEWARDRRIDPLAVEITAKQGRRATGGIWSRPDIVSVAVRTYTHVPGKSLDVRTFEVKPVSGVNVQAVYEALAHRRAATRSYVLLHLPPTGAGAPADTLQEVFAVARSHGIGVITAEEPGDYASWEEVVDAQHTQPDPERLDSFIATQLSSDTRARIIKRLH